MSSVIHLHPDLYGLTGGIETVATTGDTVGECLEQLVTRFPSIRKVVFDKDGQLQTFIEIYINRKNACPGELERAVRDGDEVHLIMTVAGG